MRYKRDFARDDLPSLLLLGLLLMTPAIAIVVADWTPGLEILPLIAIISLTMSYLLAISAFSDSASLLFSTVYGLWLVWGMGARLIPDMLTWRERLIEIAFRFRVWGEALIEGGFSQDNLIFVLLLGVLFWYLSFNAVFNLFRAQRLWHAVIPPGLAVLVNNYYYFGEARLVLFVIAYLFLTFTLAVSTNAIIRERSWRRRRIGFTPGIRFDLVRAGVVAGTVVLLAAWIIPSASASASLATAWEQSINPWHRVQDTLQRLFSGVEGGVSSTADYYGGRSLSLGGPVNLGNQPVMLVHAPPGYRYYWRSKVFDHYENGRLTATIEVRIRSDFGILRPEEEDIALRRNVQQRFDILIPATQLVYAAPQPISFSSLPLSYDAALIGPGQDFATVIAVRANEVLTEGESYGATSSISLADEASLRATGTEYPIWVRARYLQLPPNISERTRQLAASLAARHNNPYDVAREIEAYLRRNIAYNERVESPPRGVEPVDYLLFESQEGYCTYYATAMLVMLRTQGIPARVAVGFAQGEYDQAVEAYRVVEADAHAWVEVYFPGYGWIEFEPTAAELPIIRPEAPPTDSSAGGAVLGRGDQEPDAGLLEEDEQSDPLPDSADMDQRLDESTLRRFKIPVWGRLALVAIVALGLVGAGAWYWVELHGLRNLSDVSRSYARLNIYASLLGIHPPEGATPFERAALISRLVPNAESAIYRIVRLYVEEQYAPPPPTPMHRDRSNTQAREAWQEVRQALLKTALIRLLTRHPLTEETRQA